jgi:acyl carrier protein
LGQPETVGRLHGHAGHAEHPAREDAPIPELFGEGLGLDSIDALELALAIHTEFGVRTQENDEKNREYYRSVRSLAEFIRAGQARAPATGA